MFRRMEPAERIEVEAYADMFAAAPPGLGATVSRSGAAVGLRVPSAPLTELNRIVGAYTIAEIDDLERLYEGGRVVVSLDPAAGLDEELRGRGFREGHPWQKFARGIEPHTARTELELGDARQGEFGPVVASAFGAPPTVARWLDGLTGRPGWHIFTSRDGDRPVGGGALFVSGSVGWLGAAGTLPEARGRGSQGALFAARIDRARELGVSLLVTETGVPRDGQPGPSYRNMLRVGFEPTYVRPNYVRS